MGLFGCADTKANECPSSYSFRSLEGFGTVTRNESFAS
jgi:hypothetical protein